MKQHVDDKDTKTTLLNCAEKLFLENGLDGVSIREITDMAGANVAAVNYHFSGKENLYREVLRRRFTEIAHQRVALLNELEARPEPAALATIVATYVRSHFEGVMASPDGDRLLQIIYREMSPGAVAADLVANELIAPIHRTFRALIKKACPLLSAQYISRCISSITGQVLHHIRFRDVLQGYTGQTTDLEFVEAATAHITEFSLRGIGSEPHG